MLSSTHPRPNSYLVISALQDYLREYLGPMKFINKILHSWHQKWYLMIILLIACLSMERRHLTTFLGTISVSTTQGLRLCWISCLLSRSSTVPCKALYSFGFFLYCGWFGMLIWESYQIGVAHFTWEVGGQGGHEGQYIYIVVKDLTHEEVYSFGVWAFWYTWWQAQ